MKRSVLLLALFSLIGAKCIAQKEAILTIGNETTTVKEFKFVYEKNHSKDHDRYSQKSLDEYKDLYIKYRLKVLEAESLGLDSSAAFQSELKGYQKQLAKPYFTDELFTEKLAKEAYIRSKTAVKASHILIKVDETASAEDTLFAFTKISNLRDSLINGANFEELAKEYSDDPSAKRPTGQAGSGGNLGYFSSLRMVYEFENAAYNTPVGDISQPFRTQFGFHILKVYDKKTFDYKVKASHIMVQAPNKLSEQDSIERKNKIDLIYKQLKDGADWSSLCSDYSDDVNTKNEDGSLPAFSIGGRLGVPEFELASFELQHINDISSPVKTSYGWHIIRLDAKEPFLEFTDVKEEYIKKVKKDNRAQKTNDVLVGRLKQENKFKQAKKTVRYLELLEDENLTKGNWSIEDHSENLEEVLFTINKKSEYTVYKFSKYLEENQKSLKKGSLDYMVTLAYNQFVEKELIAYKEKQLMDDNFEYKMIVKEFHDGILIYNLMKEYIWDKANSDSVGLSNYYLAHQTDFTREDYIKAWVFETSELSVLADVNNDLTRNNTPENILKKYNTNGKNIISYSEQELLKSKDQLAEALTWDLDQPIEIHEVLNKDYIVKKISIHKNEFYPLEEVRGKVVAGYQKQLEEEFIATLKEKYSVELNEKEYQELVKY